MNTLADKLTEALNAKKNDINNFVWKGKKKKVNKEFVQDEIKLVDATPEQLQTFYNHCITMLYNNDKKNPGRKVLLDIIKEQRANCNVELFLKYLAVGDETTGRKPYPRFSYFQALKTFLENNKESLPKESWTTTPITLITNVPAEFSTITIDQVYKGCLDSLGIFSKKHLTTTFITKIGLWFTQQEMKDLTEKDEETGKIMDRLDVVKMRLGLRDNITLRIDQNGLSYKEFRAMINLNSCKYSELTINQLTILRDKILFKLEEEIYFHISQWEERINQIKKVAEARQINLKYFDEI